MPRPTLPPTPASSTEMKGRDATAQLAALQTSFELPPPAVPASSNDLLPSDSKLSPGPHEPAINIECPTQASETVKSAPRRRSSAATAAAAATNTAAFALPPPPPRSRKIIHVKPSTRGPQWQAESEVSPSQPSSSKTTAGGAPGNGKGGRASSSSGTGTATGTIPATPTTAGPAETSSTSKRKAPSATSAAGRKIARKTAHSLIERRRRCKMNEEFGVLKDMIPACTGEMHKLAILQV